MYRLLLIVAAAGLITRSTGSPETETSKICRVAISEVHLPENGDQFVEIYEYCSRKKNGPKTLKALAGYRLLLVELESNEAVMVVELGSASLMYRDEEKYYLLSGAGPSATLTKDGVQSISADPLKFPVKVGKVYGVVLLRSTARVTVFKLRKMLSSTAKYESRKLELEQLQNIKAGIIDFWMVCPQSSCEHHKNTIHSSVLLTHIDHRWKYQGLPGAVGGRNSLSYCGPKDIEYSSSKPSPTAPTPGAPNACSDTQSMFPSTSFKSLSPPAGNAQLPAQATTVHSRFDEYYYLHRVSETSAVKLDKRVIGRQTLRVTRTLQKAVLKSYQPVFQPSWLKDCSDDLPNEAQLLQRSFIQSWLEVVKTNGKCCFKCHVCESFYKMGLRADTNKVRKRNPITKSEGICGKSKDNNHAALMAHTEDPIHLLASRFINNVKSATLTGNFDDEMDTYDLSEASIFLPTINQVKLAYTEIRTDTPFTGHPVFVQSLKSMDVPLGFHYHDDGAAKTIAQTISQEFHRQLLLFLVQQQNPFSLILDGTHDNSNNHILCVLLQTLENGYPMNYLYHMIHLKHGETAEEMFNSLILKVEEDDHIVPGFSEFFRAKLFGYGSDGAAVMVGSKTSLIIRLKSYVGRPVVLSRCIAHNLELASSHALEKVPEGSYLKDIESIANNVYTHYLSRGSKRWIRFEGLAKDMGVNVKRFKKHYHVRWSSSHYEVLDSIVRNFYVVLEDLKNANSPNPTKSPSTPNPAKRTRPTRKPKTTKKPRVTRKPKTGQPTTTKIPLVVTLKEDVYTKYFPLYVNEVADLLDVFKEMSLNFEISKGTAFGKFKVLQNGITKLQNLQQVPGQRLSSFLSQCECLPACGTGRCSLEDIEVCEHPQCSGYFLNSFNKGRNFKALSEIRASIYESCILELRANFDLDYLKSLELFNLWDNYTPEQVNRVCTIMEWSGTTKCEEFRREFSSLPGQVKTLYPTYRDDAIGTWARVLTDGSITISPVVNDTVRAILSLPMTTADAERAFSLLTRIKSRERSRLTPANMDHIIRIKINGPKHINDFDALYYARIFLKDHVRADDEKNLAGRKESDKEKVIPKSVLF